MSRVRRFPDRSLSDALAAVAFAMCGCVSLKTSAPPVTPALVGAGRGSAAGTLAEGRRIFTGACTNCHTADPVEKYSPDQWRTIVADMAARTKLTPSREAAPLAYLTAARSMPPAP